MNKDDYLKELTRLLWKLPKDERDDVVSDYHEHFIIGIEKGRSEEEIAKALGNPKKTWQNRSMQNTWLKKRKINSQQLPIPFAERNKFICWSMKPILVK